MTIRTGKGRHKTELAPLKNSGSCGPTVAPKMILDLLNYPGMEDIDFDPPRLNIVFPPADLI